MLAAVGPVEIIVIVVYLMVIGYLGYLGFRRTQSATDYLLAGRQTHPFVMALSYGATFISTSAIVGFGGVAGMFGLSLLWLTFLNIFVGIFISFVFLGGPTRRMGHRLDAHSFPELLGRRYASRFIQVFAGLVIFLFIPLYAAAVLIGGCEFIAEKFNINYNVALLVFSVIIAAYVVVGGLKGVMYTDALQGTIMFVGMIILLVWTYSILGGPVEAHKGLAEIGDKAFGGFKAIGMNGWTAMPEAGFGARQYNLWWIVVSTIILGVGIGVLAQPQLAVRFMTVKSKRELNRAVLVGGIFILVMTGVAFTVGSLSNLYFYRSETVTGRLKHVSPAAKVIAKQERDIEVAIRCRLLHVISQKDQREVVVIHRGVDKNPKLAGLMPTAEVEIIGPDGSSVPLVPEQDLAGLVGQQVRVRPRANAFCRAVTPIDRLDAGGQTVYALNSTRIIPKYITRAMPGWFGMLFLLTLLAAAMSTLSSQFHAVGTSIGRDVWEQISGRRGHSIAVTRIGIILGIVLAVLLGYYARGGYIVARATAIFFGLCASAFLPTFLGGLFSRRVTRPGAIASMVVGFAVTAFWLGFVKDKEARALGICHALTGKHSLLLGHPNWPVVDPIVVALPLSLAVLVVVSLLTRAPGDEHLAKCFPTKQVTN
jgi:SSS family solute:Na+ symporter